ncbi:TPA_asm: hypothetical protein GY030_09200 [Listeria monocytogenes]|nr:hypothetical protein [Listeria monocytogenes]
MRIDIWTAEIYVRYTATEAEIFELTVRTIGKRKDAAIKSAKSKIISNLKKRNKPFVKLRLVWIEHTNVLEKSSYDCFVELKEKGLRKKAIMQQLKLTYHEVIFFDNYYCGRTKKLTFQKYLYFKEFMKDEQIRKRFKIPKSEYTKFIQSHN